MYVCVYMHIYMCNYFELPYNQYVSLQVVFFSKCLLLRIAMRVIGQSSYVILLCGESCYMCNSYSSLRFVFFV